MIASFIVSFFLLVLILLNNYIQIRKFCNVRVLKYTKKKYEKRDFVYFKNEKIMLVCC